MKTAKVFSVVLLVCASALVAEGKWTFTPSGTSTVAGTLTDGNWTFTLAASGGASQITAVDEGSGDLDLSDVFADTSEAGNGIKIVSINYKTVKFGTSLGMTKFKSNAELQTISNQLFDGNTTIEEVELNEGLTAINYAAFRNATALRKVILPSTLTTLGGEAFSGTSKLTDVSPLLPASVRNFSGDKVFNASGIRGRLSLTNPNLTSFANMAFFSCAGLTEVELSDSITSMGNAFNGCSSLTNLVGGLPASLMYFDQGFRNCSKLAIDIDMSVCTNMKVVSSQAFRKSTIKSVILPPGVTNISSQAFRECSKLTRVVASDPGALKKRMKDASGIIGAEAFYSAGNLGELQLPWGGTTVFSATSSFQGASGLTNIWFFGQAPAADCMDFMTSGPAAYKCVLDVSKQADEAGWRALGRDLTEAEKAKADKPEGRVFGIVEKPAGKEAWLRWKASPLYPSGLILLMR